VLCGCTATRAAPFAAESFSTIVPFFVVICPALLAKVQFMATASTDPFCTNLGAFDELVALWAKDIWRPFFAIFWRIPIQVVVAATLSRAEPSTAHKDQFTTVWAHWDIAWVFHEAVTC
jgi:hypothetical protein